jgi:hypothetical protein
MAYLTYRTSTAFSLAAGIALGACGSPTASEHEAVHGSAEAEPAEHDAMARLPVAQRAAFMAGHVTAGLALYRAGAPEEAAPHLLHPVSETHAAERAGIDALGFDPAPFVAVSAALDAGRPAGEVEPMLQAAEENMALVHRNAGGDPRVVIEYLMDTIDDEYAAGVGDGIVTDPGEYQDAYGFAVVALETLVGLWPAAGPLIASKPVPVSKVTAQTARVREVLTTAE